MISGLWWTIYIVIAIPVVVLGSVWIIVWMKHTEPYVKQRIEQEAQYRKQQRQAVQERRTETVTETVRIELVLNEELSQHLSNLTGSINHHAQVIETTAQVIPLLQELPKNPVENEGESQVSQEVSQPLVVLSQGESQASSKSRQEIIAELLLEDSNISGREVERRTGIPDATARRILKELRG